MSHVMVAPEMLATAAADMATIGSTLDVANAAAGLRTVALAPAAADEVSAGIAQLFSEHAQEYQAAARQAAAFHEQFAQTLTANSASYASAESLLAVLLTPDQNSFLMALDAGVGLVFGPGAQLSVENLQENIVFDVIGALWVLVVGAILLGFLAIIAVNAFGVWREHGYPGAV
jgi:PE family